MSKKKGLEVDRRVGIAMSVLSASQRAAVERIIRSLQSFERHAGRPGRVQTLPASGQPLYMMRATPTLRLVYTLVGDTVYVLDLVEKATLDRFAARKGPRKTDRGPRGKSRSGPVIQETGNSGGKPAEAKPGRRKAVDLAKQ